MTVELPVSASPRLAGLIARAPESAPSVLHRGPHALYLDVPGIGCVGVVASSAAAVPCALRLAAPTLAPLRGERSVIRDGVLHVDGVALLVRRLVDVRVPSMSADARAARPRAGGLARVPVRPLSPERLVGRGSGLTPVGDDVLCGWLAMHRAAGMPTEDLDARVRSLLPRTTALSAALLECAIRGEVLPQFAAYVAALGTSRADDAADVLARIGHTSGLGLLAGAVSAHRHLRQSSRSAA